MSESLKEKVYALVRSVPAGRVTTYGDIARALGNRGLARAVGNALHQNDDAFRTPCWRVLNHQGRLASHYGIGGPEMQRRFLEEDGVEVSPQGTVDLARYGWFFTENG